jgi:hypothetical protein
MRRVEAMRYFRALFVVMIEIKRFIVDLWDIWGVFDSERLVDVVVVLSPTL